MQVIKVYDNGGRTIDRYTVLIAKEGQWDIYTMAKNPNVFNQYSHSATVYRSQGDTRVNFNSLNHDLKKAIKDRCIE